MDRLEELIVEALSKFPSEDIRELVARETGLTVEEVTAKMNEAAIAAGDSFPADTFANITKGKPEGLKPSDLKRPYSVKDENGDGVVDEEDEKITAEKVTEAIDTNKDGKITYKIGYLPEKSSASSISSYGSVNPADISFEEKTAKIGVTLADILEEYSYKHAYTESSESGVNGTYEYSTTPIDLSAYDSLSNYNLEEVYYTSDTFVADGTVIFLEA